MRLIGPFVVLLIRLSKVADTAAVVGIVVTAAVAAAVVADSP